MRILSTVAAATLLVFIVLTAHAEDDAITVISPVPFAEGSGATGAVKSDCTLETRLPKFIESASKRGVKVSIGADPGENAAGRVLYLEFANVHGPGGGAWSGPKLVTVHGTLKENGEVVGTFVATRYSTGGAFGGYKGTCSILGRCIKAIGKDVAAWLRNPTMDAALGDA